MNEYDKELLKNAPSMIEGIAVQAEHLNGNHSMSLSLNDYYGMTCFGLALAGQIYEADKTNTGKVIAEGVIGGTLFLGFLSLLVANLANRSSKEEDTSYQHRPLSLPVLDNSELEAKISALERLYTCKYV